MILVVGGVASGKRAYARSLGFADDACAFDVHELVRAGADVDELVERLAGKAVVTCAEVGAGVVPLDAGERAWRDAAGALMRKLAERAERVVRMVCGIPVVLRDRVEFVLIRHGRTPGNGRHEYVGVLDQPLSEEGRAQALAAGSDERVERVYVSRLVRSQETAAIMFPNAEQVVIEGIHEMDFGAFAGRSADDMVDDAAYRAWVDGGCEGRCPGGESRAEFSDRVCASLERLLRDAASRGERRVVVVAHGGTMMAALSRFGDGSRSYYEWLVGNCEGYSIDVNVNLGGISFCDVREGYVVSYARWDD